MGAHYAHLTAVDIHVMQDSCNSYVQQSQPVCGFYRWNAENPGSVSDDCNGHGTHIASVAAGNIYGVAKDADIISVRVLDCSGAGSVMQTAAGNLHPPQLIDARCST